MRSRPLFELSVVKHTFNLFIYITGLGCQAAAAYVQSFCMILTVHFLGF